MRIEVIATTEASCDETAVVQLANAVQLFFTLHLGRARLTIPALKVPRAIPAHEMQGFATSARSGGSLLTENQIIVTSRWVEGIDNGVYYNSACSIISDHTETFDTSATTLWFTRKILQVGMTSLFGKCKSEACICNPHGDFIAFCKHCEVKARERGYLDAIVGLKSSINWINERRFDPAPELSLPLSPLAFARLPLAEHYACEYEKSNKRPFEGKLLLMVLHFLSDLLPFVRTAAAFGADYRDMILIAKPYPYSRRDQVGHNLEILGVRVFRATQTRGVKEVARYILEELKKSRSEKEIIIIEDGGYFAPILHEAEFGELCERCIGIVEQTTKGINEDRDKIKICKVPIVSVAECRFKGEYEAPEIGRITVQNIGRFVPNVKLSGRHAVVFGFGSIGEQVAAYLNRSFNMGVSVVEPIRPDRLLKALQRKDIVIDAATEFESLPDKHRIALVVGTTGRKSITRALLEKLPSCIIASTSSDRVEIDLDSLAEMAFKVTIIEEGKTEYRIKSAEGEEKVITLLAEGYPINFYAAESLPNETIDPIMTLLLLCGAAVSENRYSPGIQDPDLVDRIVADKALISHFLHLSFKRYETSNS
jgi:S-adenosylhomocysteine hydrolase